ncbi:MAG: cytidine deaminase [Acidimicrobiaceae bacterium]|jgi:homotetrameric cytidine deaminase|nr:cytidine deaminase [Acidimicrobiaceae bacterium]
MIGVLVVGDVINDVVVRPTGASAVDTDIAAEVSSVPGGSGANQVSWLAALGVPVRLAARVGIADAGIHLGLLARAGVDSALSVDPDVATGSIVVIVGDDGTRSMFTDRGANARLDADCLPPALLDGMGHLHVTGHTFVEPGARAAVVSLWQSAGAAGLSRSVDVGSAGFLGAFGSEFLDWTRGADVIFANPAEGRIVTGLDETASRDEVITALLQHAPVVVLKLGPEGSVVAAGAAIVVCPPTGGLIVDPTGAGDAFCAGFLASWLEGAGLPEAGASATRAAAAAMARVGGRPALGPDPGEANAAASGATAAPSDEVGGAPITGPPWERLRQAARAASETAYAPYSGLRVGAAGLTDGGDVLIGCNVENASFGLTLCAECGLVSALRAAAKERLVAVSVVAQDGEPLTPCGRCRQLLLDNGGPDLLVDRGPAVDPISLGELLPGAFGPGELAERREP